MRAIIDFPRDKQPRLTGLFKNPREILVARDLADVIPLLHKIEAHAGQGRWLVGMLAYEAAAAFDSAFPPPLPSPGLPCAAFAVFDEKTDMPKENAGEKFTCSPWRNETTQAEFTQIIGIIREDIASGRYYQTNFTTRLTSDFNGDAEAFFRALTEAQPGGYSFFLDCGDWQIASVSPELFFAWNPATGELTTRPMKGTSSLSHAPEALQASEKDRAENLMIVDLLRNDMSRIAGNVRVPELFAVQSLPTVRQMTSTITGTTRPKTRLADILTALFPCGSVTGAPKIAAMQAIAGYEKSARGAYCGAMGVIQPGGEALFSVGIRSVTVKDSKAVCGIGSGITWDSKPAEEYAEGQIKQRFLWRASASFELLETMRLENGEFRLLRRHMERLRKSAEYFGFALREVAVQSALANAAQQNLAGSFRVRLLSNRRGEVKTEIFPLGPNPEAVRVALAAAPVAGDDEFLRHKTTNRAVYEIHAPKNSALFDTLLYNERNEITEFTRGNVAAELEDRLVTPPESCGLLPGTLRAELLTTGKLTEQIISRDDLSRVKSLWFFNGLRGMIPARL